MMNIIIYVLHNYYVYSQKGTEGKQTLLFIYRYQRFQLTCKRIIFWYIYSNSYFENAVFSLYYNLSFKYTIIVFCVFEVATNGNRKLIQSVCVCNWCPRMKCFFILINYKNVNVRKFFDFRIECVAGCFDNYINWKW